MFHMLHHVLKFIMHDIVLLHTAEVDERNDVPCIPLLLLLLLLLRLLLICCLHLLLCSSLLAPSQGLEKGLSSPPRTCFVLLLKR